MISTFSQSRGQVASCANRFESDPSALSMSGRDIPKTYGYGGVSSLEIDICAIVTICAALAMRFTLISSCC